MDFWQGFLQYVLPILITLLLAAITYCCIKGAGWLGTKAREMKEGLKSEFAVKVVQWVEQIGKEMTSEEKLHTAAEELSKLLKNAGINVEEQEIYVLIESTVKEFNDNYWKVEETAE